MRNGLLALFFLALVSAEGAAADALSLLVRIVDGDGRPVAGAIVRAQAEPEDPQHPDPVLREETGPDGTARLSGLPDDRTVWVLAGRRGLSPALRSFSGASGARREMRIALEPGSLAVGRVVDEDGRPVAGAEVELTGMPFGFEDWNVPPLLGELRKVRVRTGRSGRFRLRDLPPGSFSLTIRHSEAAPLVADRPVEGGRSGPLGTFVLRRGATLRGTVTDPAGRPVAGARVWALAGAEIGQNGVFRTPSAVTAADGTFAVPRRPAEEEVYLWVCADGFLQGEETAPFPDEPMRVALQRAATVRGRVLGPDGSPWAGATVRAETIEQYLGCGGRMVTPCPGDEPATTDAEGRFALDRLNPDWYELVATVPGLFPGISGQLRLEAGQVLEDQELRLDRGATLTGRVVDPSGAPISGAALRTWSGWSEAEATSGVDGSFRLEGLATGTTHLTAMAVRHETATIDVEVTADEVTAEVVLTPEEDEKAVEIYGQVLGPDGSPVEGASVAVAGYHASSGPDGSFAVRFCRCRSDKPEEIVAEKRGFAPGRTTVLLEGERVDGIVIRLEAGTRVSGRLLGLTERELPAATVSFSREYSSAVAAHIDAEGRFHFGPLPAGSWKLSAVAGHRFTTRHFVLEPGQTEAFVELAFPPVQEVSGRVLDVGGLPVAHTFLLANSPEGENLGSAWTHANGSFSLRVPAGEVELAVRHQGENGKQRLRVEEQPVAGVEIRLERTATVRGRVLGLPPGELPMVFFAGTFSPLGRVEPDGSWSAQEITSGTWNLEAIYHQGSGVQVLRHTIDISPGVESLTLDLDFTDIPIVDPKILEEEKP